MAFLVGAPAINRVGQYGNVVGVYRYLINLTGPSPSNGWITQVNGFFATVTPGQTGYLLTFYETAPGVFSSRAYAPVVFPGVLGLHSWMGLAIQIGVGDFIGIGLPIAAVAPNCGIDCAGVVGLGVRHNQAGLILPIVNQAFALYAGNIMSLEGQGVTLIPPTVTTNPATEVS